MPLTETTIAPALTKAFLDFTEASQRLEEKYACLADETQELKARLRQKEEEIKRAERLASLGETAAALAHEIRNPLGALKLFLSLLSRDLKTNQHRELIANMEQSIDALEHVVGNILHFAKDAKAAKAPVNLVSLVHEEAERFRQVSKAEAVITVTHGGSPFLLGNEHGLRQVVRNLITNALEATRGRGAVKLAVVGEDPAVRLTVTDNGPGIDDQVRQRLFDPFVTTKNEGTGLGLAIVRKIVEEHGGTVAVNSLECGAEFCVTLPRKV